MERGYLKVWRKVRDTWLWKDQPFSLGQAWIDLLMRACHRPVRLQFMKRWFDLDRGQLVTSERILAESWGWSRGKVRRFMARLKKEKMIVFRTAQRASVVTVLNYAHYNDENGNGKKAQKPAKSKKKTTADAEPDTLRDPATEIYEYAAQKITQAYGRTWRQQARKGRIDQIVRVLKRTGITAEDLRYAVDRFCEDTWEDRRVAKNCDMDQIWKSQAKLTRWLEMQVGEDDKQKSDVIDREKIAAQENRKLLDNWVRTFMKRAGGDWRKARALVNEELGNDYSDKRKGEIREAIERLAGSAS